MLRRREPIPVALPLSDHVPIMDHKPFLYLVDDAPDQVFLIELAAQRTAEFGLIRTAIDSQLAYHHLLEVAANPLSRPNLIITDWKMPRMTGAELACALRAHPELRGIPLVALSTSNADADRAAALECGCVAFYQKPTHFADLIGLLRELRQKYCSTAPAATAATK